ncbi:hypothetical protein GCM10009840_10750 [Pseudolysinimonas kribbensis]|uniref:Activator of Hsp90 ATPase homologue 1/2-like C-terminal domain-containing protein n=1 Tax=Pseudolysinimonas kribbensis TaxID=433641 RepID=A0ABQ6K501_9MICO|nr:SRPBCC domain-containing protein [Pseudolysinimonas kribbensis]GMA95498.1 hypothetical protein GCM10025881_23220 [Pseudolysinimonas kribbensis]
MTDRIIGTMRRIDDRLGAVRVEDLYDTGIDDLWSALTRPERLARWIAVVEGDLRLGGTFHARFTSEWEGPMRVETCEEPHRLLLTGLEDGTQVEATLTAEGARTRLVVEERGLPVDKLHFYGAGWQVHLEDLGHLLAGEGSEWKPRWQALTPAYEALEVA